MVIAKVAFEYVAAEDDELTLNVGDIVTNIKVEDGGWWEGELDGKRGVFPENFVVIIEETVKSPAPSVPPAKPATVTCKKKFARVTFQYDAAQSDELNLNVGNLVEVLEEEDEGWWKGKLNDKIGMFPSNFVELITEDSAEPATLPEPMEPVVVSPTTANQPNDVKTTRPKSQVGLFGLSIGDLSRDKLKKTGKSVTGNDTAPLPPTHPSKPPQPSKPAEPEKKAAAPPVPAAPKAMTKSVLKAKVVFAYEPEQEDELKLSVGDIITIDNKDVFEGWMQGEHNGKIGLFPDNFVETLPVETVDVEDISEAAKPVTQHKSIKRAAKADPSPEKAPDPPQPEKPKFGMGNAFGGGIQAELQKKLAAGKPLAPGPPLKPAKASKPSPAKPTKPKPPAATKPTEPPASPQANRTASLSRHEEKPLPFMKRTTSESRKNPPKPPPPIAAAPASSAISKPEPEQSPKAKEEHEFDFDAVKSNGQLKHIQRVKPPSKNPPSKFKNGVSESGESAVNDSKEVEELKNQVKSLQEKMSEMEKRFHQLTKQVLEDLAKSNKEQSAQQIDIDCLKKQVELLTK